MYLHITKESVQLYNIIIYFNDSSPFTEHASLKADIFSRAISSQISAQMIRPAIDGNGFT